jgi:hypothetical protein
MPARAGNHHRVRLELHRYVHVVIEQGAAALMHGG